MSSDRSSKTPLMVLGFLFIVGVAVMPDSVFSAAPVFVAEAEMPAVTYTDSAAVYLQADARLAHPYVSKKGRTESVVRLKVKAPERHREVESGRDVVIVIDRSGSMSGENKIGFARDGVRAAVAQLNDRDRFALVSFSDYATVHHGLRSTEEAEDVESIVNAIHPGGSTHLSDALYKAQGILARAENSREKQILVLSDGMANRGLQGEQLARLGGELGKEGIVIAAMGVGHDFDVNTFIALGEGSGGGYAHVTRADRISDAIAGELNRISDVLVGDMRVVLHPAPGVQIGEVYKYRTQRHGEAVEILAPTLRSGEEREFLIDVTTTGTRITANEEPRIVNVEITYTRPAGSELPARPEKLVLSLEAKPTLRNEDIETFAELEILAARDLLRSDLAWAATSPNLSRGNYDQAIADLREEAARLEKANRRYKSESVAQKVKTLLGTAAKISPSMSFEDAVSVETMGRNQAALSAGIY